MYKTNQFFATRWVAIKHFGSRKPTVLTNYQKIEIFLTL